MSQEINLYNGPAPSAAAVTEAAEPLIISASGWRKVFAADGDEESATGEISLPDQGLVLAAAEAFHRYLAERSSGAAREQALCVVVGRDSRPTGEAIARLAARVLLARGHRVAMTGICALPELIAYTADRPDAGAFFYVSASHNPLGHNGFKFGDADGAVLAGSESSRIADHFSSICADDNALAETHGVTAALAEERLDEVIRGTAAVKEEAARRYREATESVASALDDPIRRRRVVAGFRRALEETPLGLAVDFNGSARSVSVDIDLLSDLGVRIRAMNDRPGEVAHQIVPEGAGLEPCARFLEEVHREHPEFLAGYVPDNDGDRGNVIYLDPETGRARAIHAQEVFALACLAELLWLRALDLVPVDARGRFAVPVAVVANGPTSMRVDEVAGAFGAEVHRAEVGEANVVGLARRLRDEGYTVRILGEGSNGGNITHPAVVRDPLQTLLALLKLIRYRDVRTGRTLLSWWRSDADAPSGGALPTVGAVLRELPAYTTTSAYEERAILRIRAVDHRRLKREYERVFGEEWARRADDLRRDYGIHSWREINYESMEAREGVGPDFRSGAEKGGLKIVFTDAADRDVAFIWMRGSGTEPVYRVLADVRGDRAAAHDDLLAWHTEMVRRADHAAVDSDT
ncbi:MAG: phosphatidylglycerol lysyltransferase, partial [Spirochaetota bacterium]